MRNGWKIKFSITWGIPSKHSFWPNQKIMALVNAIIHRIELFSILCLVALYSQSDDVLEEIFFSRSVEWKSALRHF